MAKIPPIKRLTLEEYADQANWIGRLFLVLNSFFEAIVSALSNNLTFSDNMQAMVKVLTVNGTYPVNFTWTPKNKPVAVLVGRVADSTTPAATINSACTISWSYANGTVSINNVGGLTLNTTGTTNTSTSLTNVICADRVIVGQTVTGTGIPASTTVVSVSGSTVTLSAAATASASNVNLTFNGKTYLVTVIGVAG